MSTLQHCVRQYVAPESVLLVLVVLLLVLLITLLFSITISFTSIRLIIFSVVFGFKLQQYPGQGRESGGGGQVPPNFMAQWQWDGYACAPPPQILAITRHVNIFAPPPRKKSFPRPWRYRNLVGTKSKGILRLDPKVVRSAT